MKRILIDVFIMAIVTYIPRVLPIALLNKKLKSKFLQDFLYYVPYGVLGVMVFPDIIFSTGNIYSGIFGMIVALIMSYFNKGLLKVTLSTIGAVYLFNLFVK